MGLVLWKLSKGMKFIYIYIYIYIEFYCVSLYACCSMG